MGRVREGEREVRPPRSNRIVIWCTVETKRRWRASLVDMGVRNSEEALNGLLDLYDLMSTIVGERRVGELLKKIELYLGIGLRMKQVPRGS